MQIDLTFRPRLAPPGLHVMVPEGGTTLALNGVGIDLSGLEPGDELNLPLPWLAGPITCDRQGRRKALLVLPMGPRAPEATRFPAPVPDARGTVALPPYDRDAEGRDVPQWSGPAPRVSPFAIPEGALRRADELAAARLAEARSHAVLHRSQLAMALLAERRIDEADALAMAAGQVPPAMTDALAALDAAEPGAGFTAQMRWMDAAGFIGRLDPLLVAWSDGRIGARPLDTIFGLTP